MNKSTTAIVSACMIGAVLGAANYFTHSAAVPVIAPAMDEPDTAITADIPAMQLAKFQAHEYQKSACRVLYGEHYRPSEEGACTAPVDCTSCVTHSGRTRNAVIHDNAWHPTKAQSPDYAAMMRQDKLVFHMAMASQASTEAGRQAFNHVTRCQRIWSAADVQCNHS